MKNSRVNLNESKQTHSSSIPHNLFYVLRGIHHGRSVGAICGEFGELGDLEWEGLRIDDVPVESVDLEGNVSIRQTDGRRRWTNRRVKEREQRKAKGEDDGYEW
jgi:hypothetical protein